MILDVKCPECAALIKQDITLAGTLCSCPQCHSNYTAPATSVVPGSKLGDYWIQKRLGGSIRSDVFIAKDLKGGHRVALKVFSPLVNLTEDGAKKYFSIFAAPAFKQNSGIIQPRSVGVIEAFPYIATDFIQGEDLRKHLKRVGTFPEQKLVDITLACSTTLQRIWDETGRFHGHLRPENMMSTHGDRVVLFDFGLDLLMSDADNATAHDPKLAPYRSPEQNKGDRGDFRSDMYSLGASLYFLATGAKPLAAGVSNSMLFEEDDMLMPSLADVNQNISEKFSNLISTLLHLDPSMRPKSWQIFMDQVEDFKSSQLSSQILMPEQMAAVAVESSQPAVPEPPAEAAPVAKRRLPYRARKKQRDVIRRSLSDRARGSDTGIPGWVVFLLLLCLLALGGMFFYLAYLTSSR